MPSLVGSEMCIRDRVYILSSTGDVLFQQNNNITDETNLLKSSNNEFSGLVKQRIKLKRVLKV